ncbi:MAG: type IV secretory system conjugative DNA transfer family protein, partial [Acetobacteraceae bacterium]|nr:type IV secretory system conjugative DNA transfer family protein [Acetobacteraceae bacterium]
SRGRNTNRHEIRRSLIKPDEIREARADEMFVLAAGCAPIRCGVPLYFRREWEGSIAGSSRFVRPSAAQSAPAEPAA